METIIARALRTAVLLLFSAFSFPLIGISHSYAAETITVNQDFNGKEIKVRMGATIQVQLRQPGATGYIWEIQDLDR
jgi:hypothetical protein